MSKDGKHSKPVAHFAKEVIHGRILKPGLFPDWLLDGAATAIALRGKVSTLSSFERVLAATRFREPDHVPCCPLTFLGSSRRLSGKSFAEVSRHPEMAAETLVAMFNVVGGDILGAGFDLSVEAADFGQRIIYPERSTAHPDYDDPVIKDVADYRKIKAIDFDSAPRMQSVVKMARIIAERVGKRAVLSGFVFGPLGVLNMMRGAKHFLRDCMNYPREVMAGAETITGVLLEYIDAQCDVGVQCVALDTLFASWNGLSKERWEMLEAPFAREMATVVRRRGCSVAVHNCGDGIYFDSQIRAMDPGIISFAQLPDDCRDAAELKRRYGRDVVLMGYVSTPLLTHGTPFEVMEECRRQIEELADGGGFILAPGCEFPPDAPLENAVALVAAARFYG